MEEKPKKKEWVSNDYELTDLVKWDTLRDLGKSLASHTSHSSTPRCPLLTDN
jgi:hypothetical protein